MDFIVHPLKGANAVEFGMRSDQVKAAMNAPSVSGDIRAASKEFPTDYFEEAGLFAYYDAEGFLDGLEFVEPSRPLLQGVNMLTLSVEMATDLLKRMDAGTIVESDGAVSRRLSIGIWSSEAFEGDKNVPVEAFLIGRPGYYDDVQ